MASTMDGKAIESETSGTAKRTRCSIRRSVQSSDCVTRSTMKEAPRHAVFATAELLESVFLYLDFKDAFTAMRVCKQFRNIVMASVNIQKKLFLRPSGKPSSTWMLLGPTVPSTDDRWLENRCLFVKQTDSVIALPDGVASYGISRFAALSPLLELVWYEDECALRRLVPLEPIYGEDEDAQYMPPMHNEYVKLRHLQRLPTRWPGSFAQMQLTDPPCRKIRYIASWEPRETPFYDKRTEADTLESETGVTLGMIRDHAVNKRISYCEAYNESVKAYNDELESHREHLDISEPYRSRTAALAKRITG